MYCKMLYQVVIHFKSSIKENVYTKVGYYRITVGFLLNYMNFVFVLNA